MRDSASERCERLAENRRCARAVPAALAVACLLTGCHSFGGARQTAASTENEKVAEAPKTPLMLFPERLEEGYTLILPGAWGDLTSDYGILKGLEDADHRAAVELHDWTTVPKRIAFNIRNAQHNHEQALAVAAKIVQYQDHYPGRPVHLVGYSGGAGIVIQALEALPEDRKITRAVMLAPDVSAGYDLRKALRRTQQGIHNFYSPFDVTVLMVAGTAVGTTDGKHAIAGGAIGFYPPKSLSKAERKEYKARVTQKQYALGMLRHGHTGGHFGWTGRSFIASRLAPMLHTSPVTRLPEIDPTAETPETSLAGSSAEQTLESTPLKTGEAAPDAVIPASHAGD